MTKNDIRVRRETLENYVTDIFVCAGLEEQQASTIAKHLVFANVRGVDSHGVNRVEIYTKRLDLGLINKKFDHFVVKETPISALIDANNTPGISVATEGIKLAIEKAKQTGIGIVGIQNSNHCGMLADYVNYAVKEDLIVLATTNAPSNMPPWGGKERFFGTNPFAYGIPAGKENHIIFDMATSVVARGKIILAQKNNQKIPVGWALSPDGKPTTDPDVALDGVVLPVGGPKGYGLTFLVESLSAILTGAAYGPFIGDLYKDLDKKQNVGHFFLVMKADLFISLNEFKEKMDAMIQEVRNIPLMEGVEKIYLPGEIELEVQQDREQNGIPLSPEIIQELLTVGDHYNVSSTLIENKISK